MILYQALSSYQILECMLHRYFFYPNEHAVLLLGTYITERMPDYLSLHTQGFFDEICLFQFGGAGGKEEQILEKIQQKFPGIRAHLYPIRNDFFGTTITVAGLVTGGDLIRQLEGRPLGRRLLIPSVMLRSGESVFLDDVTVKQVEKALQVPVDIVKSSGYDLVESIIGAGKVGSVRGQAENYRPYESDVPTRR